MLDDRALAMEESYAREERRWVLIGMSDQARLLTVVYALRQDRIRAISARKATQREARTHAQRV